MADESLTFRAFGEDVSAGRMFGNLGDKADDASESIHGLGDESKSLDTRLEETRLHVKALIQDFERTGDVALFRDIRRDRSTISMLESFRKELGQVGDDAEKVGRQVSQGTIGSLGDALGSLPSELKGAAIVGLVGLAVVAAPFIGAAVGGAVLGGVGLGGIIGGVFAAAQDPRVHDAGAQLGENLLTGLKATGRSLVNPLLDEMATVQRAGDVFTADLAAGFARLAPLVKPLAEGLQGFAENLDLDKVFKAAEPLVRAFANELPGLASALSDMFQSIEDGGDGATEGLIALFRAGEDVLRFIGGLIEGNAEIYDWLVRNTAAVTDFGMAFADGFSFLHFIPGAGQAFDFFTGKLKNANDMTHGLIDEMNKAKDAGNDWNGTLATTASNADAAAQATKEFDDGIRTLFGQLMGLEEAQVRYNLDLIKAREELAKGTKTLAINSEEGLKNRQVLDALVNDIERVREAHIANGMSVERANQLYEQQIRQLIAMAEKIGISKTEVERYARALRDVPKTVAAEVKTTGLNPALEHAIALNRMFDELDGRNVHSTVTTEFASYRAGERNPQGRAGGGDVMAGNTYWVGENGPEMVTFGANGRVIPAPQSAAIAASASREPVRVVFDVTGADEDMKRFIRKIVRVEGGGDVQVAFGR